MTEAHRARADHAWARRSRQQLLAAVSHDLRAPLGTILLWERVLRERFQEDGVRERALDAIRESALAQSELIADLADVAAVLDGTRTLQLERISLESVVTTAIELKVESAGRKRVTLVRDYRLPLGHVRADRARLRHLLAAVIDRVVHATRAGRTVTICARRKQGSMLLAIGDLDQDQGTHEDVSARELQIVLANEVLVLHGGVLHMTRPVGGGTPTVWIQLPLSRRRTTKS